VNIYAPALVLSVHVLCRYYHSQSKVFVDMCIIILSPNIFFFNLQLNHMQFGYVTEHSTRWVALLGGPPFGFRSGSELGGPNERFWNPVSNYAKMGPRACTLQTGPTNPPEIFPSNFKMPQMYIVFSRNKESYDAFIPYRPNFFQKSLYLILIHGAIFFLHFFIEFLHDWFVEYPETL
jgi:hypothetical protein